MAKYIVLLIIFCTSCISPHIEDRCLLANLKITKLQIEDVIQNQSHAKVECASKE